MKELMMNKKGKDEKNVKEEENQQFNIAVWAIFNEFVAREIEGADFEYELEGGHLEFTLTFSNIKFEEKKKSKIITLGEDTRGN